MEGRTASTLMGGWVWDFENWIQPTLISGYIVVLDELRYELPQFKQQLDSFSSPFDHWRTFEPVSAPQSNNGPKPTFGSWAVVASSHRDRVSGNG